MVFGRLGSEAAQPTFTFPCLSLAEDFNRIFLLEVAGIAIGSEREGGRDKPVQPELWDLQLEFAHEQSRHVVTLGVDPQLGQQVQWRPLEVHYHQVPAVQSNSLQDKYGEFYFYFWKQSKRHKLYFLNIFHVRTVHVRTWGIFAAGVTVRLEPIAKHKSAFSE